MELIDTAIWDMTPQQLIDRDTIFSLYDIIEPERARLRAIMESRAEQLEMSKSFAKMIKAYDAYEKEFNDAYNKSIVEGRAELPIKFDGKGVPLQTTDNILIIMRNDAYFAGLKFNLLTYAPEIHENNTIRRWSDADDSASRHYIESTYNIYNIAKHDDATRILFTERAYHPIRDIIDSAEWDGTERIEQFLTEWLWADNTPYVREVSRLIFAGGIHRLYNPGCKFDDVAVLVGKQGAGKSSIIQFLAMQPQFYAEIWEFDGQKGVEAVEGAWICEISEMLALTKSKEVEAVKAFVTRQIDRYRKPYDKHVSEYSRQCIFVGTTNRSTFLTDKTGNRRFYPVRINQTGYYLFDREEEVRNYILQCWAEAKAKMERGELKPYADRDLIEQIQAEQANAVEDDYRVGMIESYLENQNEVCILELWKVALGNEFSKPSKKDSNDISLILQNFADWDKEDKPKRIKEFGLQRYWKRVKPISEIAQEALLREGELPF